MVKPLFQNVFVSYMLGKIAYCYISLISLTSKFEVTGVEEASQIIKDKNGAILVAWHGRVLLLPCYGAKITKVKALVSPHTDGRIIASFLKSYNIDTIDGSSDRNAQKAVFNILKELKEGTSVAIISDGPRGPRMRLNKSIIYFAQKTGKPIIGFSYSAKNAKIIKKSWDMMILPKLFSKGVYGTTKPFYVPKDATEEELEELRLKFENILNDLLFEQDEKCNIEKILPNDTAKTKKRR